jgi:hypothetical protein
LKRFYWKILVATAAVLMPWRTLCLLELVRPVAFFNASIALCQANRKGFNGSVFVASRTPLVPWDALGFSSVQAGSESQSAARACELVLEMGLSATRARFWWNVEEAHGV